MLRKAADAAPRGFEEYGGWRNENHYGDLLVEEKLAKRSERMGPLRPTARGYELLAAIGAGGKKERLLRLIGAGVAIARALRTVVDENTKEALGENPCDLGALKTHKALTEVTGEGEATWLAWCGEPHHDPMLAPAWAVVTEGGERRLGDADERDRHQAAAFRTLVRSGVSDNEATQG